MKFTILMAFLALASAEDCFNAVKGYGQCLQGQMKADHEANKDKLQALFKEMGNCASQYNCNNHPHPMTTTPHPRTTPPQARQNFEQIIKCFAAVKAEVGPQCIPADVGEHAEAGHGGFAGPAGQQHAAPMFQPDPRMMMKMIYGLCHNDAKNTSLFLQCGLAGIEKAGATDYLLPPSFFCRAKEQCKAQKPSQACKDQLCACGKQAMQSFNSSADCAPIREMGQKMAQAQANRPAKPHQDAAPQANRCAQHQAGFGAGHPGMEGMQHHMNPCDQVEDPVDHFCNEFHAADRFAKWKQQLSQADACFAAHNAA